MYSCWWSLFFSCQDVIRNDTIHDTMKMEKDIVIAIDTIVMTGIIIITRGTITGTTGHM